MIEITPSVELEEIMKRLGDLEKKAPNVIQKAINKTAKDAQKALFHKAKETYTVKSSQFKSKDDSLKIKKASVSNLTAFLNSTGSPLALYGFRVKADDSSTMAKVKKANGLKALKIDDRWAFVTKMKSGHQGVFQRRGKSRLPIKELSSVSVPKMIGNETEVYGVLEPQIGNWLSTHVEEEIQKLTGGRS